MQMDYYPMKPCFHLVKLSRLQEARAAVFFKTSRVIQKHHFLGEIKSSPSESPLMEKKNSLKEDHEETKLSLSDIETRNPVSEVGSATVPHRAVVEERTVSFKLGDLEEAPERERLPSIDLKEETSIDGSVNGAWTLLGDRRVSLCFLYH